MKKTNIFSKLISDVTASMAQPLTESVNPVKTTTLSEGEFTLSIDEIDDFKVLGRTPNGTKISFQYEGSTHEGLLKNGVISVYDSYDELEESEEYSDVRAVIKGYAKKLVAVDPSDIVDLYLTSSDEEAYDKAQEDHDISQSDRRTLRCLIVSTKDIADYYQNVLADTNIEYLKDSFRKYGRDGLEENLNSNERYLEEGLLSGILEKAALLVSTPKHVADSWYVGADSEMRKLKSLLSPSNVEKYAASLIALQRVREEAASMKSSKAALAFLSDQQKIESLIKKHVEEILKTGLLKNESLCESVEDVKKLANKLTVGDKTNFGTILSIDSDSITFKARDTGKTKIKFSDRKMGSKDYILSKLAKIGKDSEVGAYKNKKLNESMLTESSNTVFLVQEVEAYEPASILGIASDLKQAKLLIKERLSNVHSHDDNLQFEVYGIPLNTFSENYGEWGDAVFEYTWIRSKNQNIETDLTEDSKSLNESDSVHTVTPEKIFNVIISQDFADFYGYDDDHIRKSVTRESSLLDRYMQGDLDRDEEAAAKIELLKEIKRMFA